MLKKPPATPLVTGLITAALAFVLPVVTGLISGNMSWRDFGFIVLLTIAAFLIGFLAAQRRRTS